jgi:hypothetical protein
VGAARLEPLLDEAGKPVAGKEWSDAEEITRAADGQFFVSFERHHRIWRYASTDGVPVGPAHPVSVPDAIESLPENSGIEAMTVESGDNLLLIAEGGERAANESRGWYGNGDKWIELAVERSDGFEPTSLARSPGPQTVLLERRFTEADGPAARISILVPSVASSRTAGFTLATLRRPLSVDNFEGLVVRPAADGDIYVYLLSDDNQSDSQRTLLLQFRTRLN